MKSYRITLNSNDRQSGSVDNAFFPVNFPISDVGDDAGKPWMLWLESFLVEDTEDVIANRTFAVRLRQAANGTVFCTDQLPNDILGVFQGARTMRQFAEEGVACYDKTLFNSKLWNVYLTSPRFSALPYLSRAYPPVPMSAATQAVVAPYGSGSYVASSSTNSTNHEAYRAFDGTLTGYWETGSNYSTINGLYSGSVNTKVGTQYYYGDYLQIQLPVGVSVSSYSMTTPGDEPQNVHLFGSFDGATWNLLSADTAPAWVNSQYSKVVADSQPFTYYRFVFGKSYNTATVQLSSVLLNTEVTWSATLVAWKGDKAKK